MTEWRFQRDAIREFQLRRAGFDAGSGEIALV